MEAIELLEKYKKRFDSRLELFFKKKLEQIKGVDPVTRQAVKMIADFTMAGGKRIRPAMVYYGYLVAGGRDGEEIIEASMGIELIHTFLLIHDDIIDKDNKRHGIPTVHEKYKKIGMTFSPNKDCNHFGNSMAIITGDMSATMANEIIFNARFEPEIIIRALDKMQNIVYATIPGEMLDVIMENRGSATEKEILRMFEGKTSRYTFEGPLHLGAVLAKGSDKILETFSRYSIPLGKAFQIRDDILGLFGDEKKLGKPVGSDISESKQTILLIKAFERATKDQKEILKSCLGKKNLTKNNLEDFKKIIKDTGSLEYCQKLAGNFADESRRAISEIEFKSKEAKVFLNGIIEYVIRREV